MSELDPETRHGEHVHATQNEDELIGLHEWQKQQDNKLRYVTRVLIVGFLMFTLGIAYAMWRNHDLANQNAENTKNLAQLVNRNAMLTQDVARASYTADLVGWNACMDRNARAQAGLVQFRRLVKAHSKDGNTNAVKAWREYLKSQSKFKIPPCGPKPTYYPPKIPGATITSTTTRGGSP
jgi:cell division protein FtsB